MDGREAGLKECVWGLAVKCSQLVGGRWAVLIAQPDGMGVATRPGMLMIATEVSRVMKEEWAASGRRTADTDGWPRKG
jgi:hypothetical protein